MRGLSKPNQGNIFEMKSHKIGTLQSPCLSQRSTINVIDLAPQVQPKTGFTSDSEAAQVDINIW
jgi:hypothetical protein